MGRKLKYPFDLCLESPQDLRMESKAESKKVRSLAWNYAKARGKKATCNERRDDGRLILTVAIV